MSENTAEFAPVIKPLDLLTQDLEMTERINGIMDRVPTYTLNSVTDMLRKPQENYVHLYGRGAFGVVFGFGNESEKLAVKLPLDTFPPDQMQSLVNSVKSNDPDPIDYAYDDLGTYLNNMPYRPVNPESTILNQSIALHTAEMVAPGSTPQLKGMIGNGNNLAGYIMEAVEGERVTDMTEKDKAIEATLKLHGIVADTGDGGVLRKADGSVCFADIGIDPNTPEYETFEKILKNWKNHS